jgi:class 3 adenylate cyclase/tetratricopeptide (TPR) repeat protein
VVSGHRSDPADGPLTAELRSVTVMFCDLVGSTAMSEQLDPEELLEVTHAYQAVCREVIERHDGHIGQYQGDGILVYFGYPRAHDDDVQRSVRSALEILRAIEGLNSELGHGRPLLRTRIGIHTGPVVAGALVAGSAELVTLGNTPNVAARLQALAEPDSVLVSAASQRLVEGYFRWSDRGTVTLKGVSAPMEVYRPLEESSVRTAFELAIRQGLRRFFGRRAELEALRRLYRAAREGRGQVVRVRGEGGIGKSRLLHAIREDADSLDGIWLTGRCTAQSQNTALYPVIEVVRQLLGFETDDDMGDRVRKLEDALKQADLADPDKIRLLAKLLALEPGATAPPLMISPELQRIRTLETLRDLLAHTSRRSPLAITIEDLHWVDPSTLEFLELLTDSIANQRILLLLSYRPTFDPAARNISNVTELSLAPLLDVEVRSIIAEITEGNPLPASVVDRIVERTDGVPLFVEELTKMVLESGGAGDHCSIPATLESSLRTRLDRLGDAKAVVQLAAVVGREFSYAMLSSVGVFDDPLLERALRALVSAELLGQTGSPPDSHYTFRHALIQDAAYQSLLKRVRREYHGRIAQAAVAGSWNVVVDQPEFVAHHFTEAEMHEQAVHHWQLAGQQALDRSANAEAIAHFNRGLRVVEALPDDRARWQRELALVMGLGPALNVARGYGAPEVERTYNRALELCEKLGDAPELFWVLWGLGAFHQSRGQHAKALERGLHMRRLAESRRELQAEAHFGVGSSLFYLGELDAAREELERGTNFFLGQMTERGVSPTGHHAGVMSLGYLAIALWHLGYPDQARARCEEGVALARRTGHPFMQFQSRHWGTFVHYLLRDREQTQAYAEEASKLSCEYGFPFGEMASSMTLNWLRATAGSAAAVDALRSGVAAYRGLGARVGLTYFLSMLADACRAVGRVDDGLVVIEEAVREVEETGERCWEAELYRIRGELLASRDAAEAQRSFEQALAVARSQRARSLELRSAMGLAGLRQRDARQAEPPMFFADVYETFEEGHATTDLMTAKRLLEE